MSEETSTSNADEKPPELQTVILWTIRFPDGSMITVAVNAPTIIEYEQDLASVNFHEHLLDRLELLETIASLPTKRNKLDTQPLDY